MIIFSSSRLQYRLELIWMNRSISIDPQCCGAAKDLISVNIK